MGEKLWHKPKITLGSITVEILQSLFDAMDDVAMHNINRYQAYGAINKTYRWYSRSQSARVLGELQRRGYLRISNAGGGSSVEFTTKAKMKIIDRITAEREPSERYHFVSFDLPQEFRKKRDQLRRSIKRPGFVQIQQSLWVTNKDVGDLLQAIAGELEVEKYLVYIVSSMSDIDEVLKNKFKNITK